MHISRDENESELVLEYKGYSLRGTLQILVTITRNITESDDINTFFLKKIFRLNTPQNNIFLKMIDTTKIIKFSFTSKSSDLFDI